jgi:hypothetical protein
MTELYPHWVANQSWLMFGFPQAANSSSQKPVGRPVFPSWLCDVKTISIFILSSSILRDAHTIESGDGYHSSASSIKLGRRNVPQSFDQWIVVNIRRKQNFLNDLSNSGGAVRLSREGQTTGQPESVPGRYATRKIRQSPVDSRPPCSTNKWSGSAQPDTRSIPCPVRPALLYKTSGPAMASAQPSRRTPCAS